MILNSYYIRNIAKMGKVGQPTIKEALFYELGEWDWKILGKTEWNEFPFEHQYLLLNFNKENYLIIIIKRDDGKYIAVNVSFYLTITINKS